MSRREPKKWDVQIVSIDGPRTGELEHLQIPVNRMSSTGLDLFLKVLLAKHSGCDAESLLPFFVNNRRGYPVRQTNWDVRHFFDVERMKCGISCGDGPIFASAYLPMTESMATFVTEQRSIGS